MGEISDIRSKPRPDIICLERVANFKADGAVGWGISFSIVGDHDNRPTDMTNVVVIMKDEDDINRQNNRREDGQHIYPRRTGEHTCPERLQTTTGGDI